MRTASQTGSGVTKGIFEGERERNINKYILVFFIEHTFIARTKDLSMASSHFLSLLPAASCMLFLPFSRRIQDRGLQ